MTKIPSAGLDLRNYFLFWKDVIALTGKSEMTIRRAIKRNEFPSPVKLFPGGRRLLSGNQMSTSGSRVDGLPMEVSNVSYGKEDKQHQSI